MVVTSDGNMASARIGKLWVACSGRRPITDATWREYLRHAAESVKNHGPYHGVLFWAPKSGPSAAQRRMLTDEYAKAVRLDAQRRIVLISDSAIVRGTITAIDWFTRKNFLAFAPKNVHQAIAWLAEDIQFDRKEAELALEKVICAVHGQAESQTQLG
jgi:hypothetical protein